MPLSRDQVRAIFMAIMLGDALGQPVETLSAAKIHELTDSHGVTGFIDPIQTAIPENRLLRAGDTTDDWQLTAVMAECLIADNGFNLESIARAHVAARSGGKGWGGTTRRAIDELAEWFESGGQAGRSPATPAPSYSPRHGAGNGVAMKIAPLAIWHGLRETPIDVIRGDIVALGQLTHSQSEAWDTAHLLAAAIKGFAGKPGELVYAQIRAEVEPFMTPEDESSIRLRNKLDLLAQNFGDPGAIEAEITPGFAAAESVIYALGLAWCYPFDYRRAVLTAVNAGRDSDSTAAITGLLVALNVGLTGIPGEWQHFRPEYQSALDLADRLYTAATSV